MFFLLTLIFALSFISVLVLYAIEAKKGPLPRIVFTAAQWFLAAALLSGLLLFISPLWS